MTIMRYLYLSIALAVVPGCGDAHLIRWRPTESQRQAADLAVQAADSMAAVAPASHVQVARAGQEATRTTQRYMGLPRERARIREPNEVAGTIAAADMVAGDRPTLAQGAEYAVATGLGWTEAILGLMGTVAGTWGATTVARRVKSYRDQARKTGSALRETVRAIDETMDELGPEAVAAMRATLSRHQGGESKIAVAEAKQAS
jgi:hypothetical protein